MTLREFASAPRRAAPRARPPRRGAEPGAALPPEMLEERHRARGLDPAAARRAARLELGGDAQIAEAWRDQRSLPIARHAVAGHPLRAPHAAAHAGLHRRRAASRWRSASAPTPRSSRSSTPSSCARCRTPSRIGSSTVGDRTPAGFSSNVGFATLIDWRERSRSFEQLALMRGWGPTLVVNGEAERLAGGARQLELLRDDGRASGARPRDSRADDDRPNHWRVLLLSDGLWRRRFGADPSVVGRTITMNDREYRVDRRDAAVVRAARRDPATSTRGRDVGAASATTAPAIRRAAAASTCAGSAG